MRGCAARIATLVAGISGARWSARHSCAGSHGVARSHAAAGGVMMHHMMMMGAVMDNMMVGYMMGSASAAGCTHPAAGRGAHRAGGRSHAPAAGAHAAT